jgi:hypothetical protein
MTGTSSKAVDAFTAVPDKDDDDEREDDEW